LIIEGDRCKGCGHPWAQHYTGLDNKVHCVVMRYAGSNYQCDCEDGVSRSRDERCESERRHQANLDAIERSRVATLNKRPLSMMSATHMRGSE
jgi:hypothetical protein